jgi:FkbM family methyltransferase
MSRYSRPGNPNLHEPVEEKWLQHVLGQVESQSPRFLDVGAAVGYYSILVKLLRPNAFVVAVEALPRHVRRMWANFAINDISKGDLTIIESAIGTTNDVGTFVSDGYSSRLITSIPPASSMQVKVRTLRSILNECGPIDIMKMDIQGAELEVLLSATDTLLGGAIGTIIVGTHGPHVHALLRNFLSATAFVIQFDDPNPPFQPDGLIVAHCANPQRSRSRRSERGVSLLHRGRYSA